MKDCFEYLTEIWSAVKLFNSSNVINAIIFVNHFENMCSENWNLIAFLNTQESKY